MGERKGQNFYYPPDFDPKKHGNLNNYHGVHALRERANKLDQGILIIRFEMPYNIWCTECKPEPKHIGMGVRYNAQKTKIGMYYTTPVYQFKMNCHLCGGHIIIKTDPANMDYVIVQGARRVEQRWDPTENGQIVPDDKSVGRKLADDAMYKLEHHTGDKGKASDDHPAIVGLYDIQDRVRDDYLANRILRDQFRTGKKERKAQKEVDDKLKAKGSLAKGLPLLKEREKDVRMAQLLSIQAGLEAEERQREDRGAIEDEDIFSGFSNSFSSPSSSISKTSSKTSSSGKKLALHLVNKAVRAPQATLLKRKGFGLVVKSLKKELGVKAISNSEVLKGCQVKSNKQTFISSKNLCNEKVQTNVKVTIKEDQVSLTNDDNHNFNGPTLAEATDLINVSTVEASTNESKCVEHLITDQKLCETSLNNSKKIENTIDKNISNQEENVPVTPLNSKYPEHPSITDDKTDNESNHDPSSNEKSSSVTVNSSGNSLSSSVSINSSGNSLSSYVTVNSSGNSLSSSVSINSSGNSLSLLSCDYGSTSGSETD